MTPEIIGVITIALLLPLIIMGIHVALALGVLSILGVWWITGSLDIAINLVGNTAYATVNDYVFGVAPMFMLMGLLANLSGSSDDAYNAAQIIFRRIRGGIAMATVMANAIFAAITGTSVASAAIFSKIAVPQMERLGYQRRLSLGTVTGSSVLGMLIPAQLLPDCVRHHYRRVHWQAFRSRSRARPGAVGRIHSRHHCHG